jgi:hypothetical protein
MIEGAPKGRILWQEAYALGKMLDHSSWQKGDHVLPRLITGSDIDACFARGQQPGQTHFVFEDRLHDGATIYCELTRQFANWKNIRFAQRWVYESAIRYGPHCAVLCQHAVTPDEERAIDTRQDVIAFQVMLFDFEFVFSRMFKRWEKFVFAWFDNPLKVRRQLLGMLMP